MNSEISSNAHFLYEKLFHVCNNKMQVFIG